MPAPFEAFFLPVPGDNPGQRFCIFHPAQGAHAKGAVLYIHPFAEEMNKSRRMAALQSRALAAAGFAVLQIDLLGCGDSSGDIGDAGWQDWIDDVVRGALWLIEREQAPLWLWGLRMGCLLAAQAATQLPSDAHLVFWAPATSGKLLLQQFLRLKSAANLLAGGAKGQSQEPRQRLANGESIEVAGYHIAPGLALGLEAALLAPPLRPPQQQASSRRLEWFELSTRPNAEISPVAAKALATWQDSGVATRGNVVEGPSFWQTTEIELAPALLAATVAALCLRDDRATP